MNSQQRTILLSPERIYPSFRELFSLSLRAKEPKKAIKGLDIGDKTMAR